MTRGSGAPFRAVLVGCGSRGEGHAAAYRLARRAELVGCVDLDAGRAEALADRYGVPAWSADLAGLLAAERPYLVDVCTPAASHGAVVEAALAADPGVVLVETPMTVLPEEGYRMIGRCEVAGVPLMVNSRLRFSVPLVQLRELLAGGALGAVRTVRASTRCTLLEQGTDLFDLVDFLLPGRLGSARVLAQTVGWERDPRLPDSPEYILGVLSCADGTRVYFECGPQAPEWPGRADPSLQAGLEILGDRGRIGWSADSGWRWESSVGTWGHRYRQEDIDCAAEASLLDSLGPGPQHASRLSSTHPAAARVARRAFDVAMAAQYASLLRDWVDVQSHVGDDAISALQAAQLVLA